MAGKLALEIPRENLSTSHCLVEGQARNVPSTENEVVGVNHGQHVTEGDINVLSGDRIHSQTDSRGTKDGFNVVGPLNTELGVLDKVMAVGEDGSDGGRAFVSSHTNHH